MSKAGAKNHKRLYQLRRVAIQLAEQLPEDVSEARIVLQLTQRVFEEFLMRGEFTPTDNVRRLAAVK